MSFQGTRRPIGFVISTVKIVCFLVLILVNDSSSYGQQQGVLFQFTRETGNPEYNGPLTDGEYIFGTTFDVGPQGAGFIYKVKPDGSDYQVVYDFADPIKGRNPVGTMVLGDSILYGVTFRGGVGGLGVIYRINKNGNGYEALYELGASGGGGPGSSLILSDSVLYGIGGNFIFRIDIDGTDYRVLHTFNGEDGQSVWQRLALSGRTLFGSTYLGGAHGHGVVFKLRTDGSGFTKLVDFDNTNGSNPTGGVLIAGEFVYGTTSGGAEGGVIYKVDTLGARMKYLPASDANPSGVVIHGDSLYGVTLNGGNGAGAMFRADTALTGVERTYTLSYATGGSAEAPLLFVDGKIYCQAPFGTYNYGALFRVNPDGTGFESLVQFESQNQGYFPKGSLLASNGYYFGVTEAGGRYNHGVVYKLGDDGSSFQVIHDFNGVEGAMPSSTLTIVDSVMYGLTHMGGSEGTGTIFRLNRDGSDFEVVHGFQTPTGTFADGALTYHDSALYGVANAGGSENSGVMFRFDLSTETYEVLFDFKNTSEATPTGDVEIRDSIFYGLVYGATGNQILYSIRPDGSDYTVVLDTSTVAAGRQGGSLVVTDSMIYVVSRYGGQTDRGVLYRIGRDGSNFQQLLDFNHNIGVDPLGDLVLFGDTLFFMLRDGGSHGYGGPASCRTDGTGLRFLDQSINGRTNTEALPLRTEGSLSINGKRLVGATAKVFQLHSLENIVAYDIAPARSAQTITFQALAGRTYGDGTFQLGAIADSELPVTYTSSNQQVATVEQNLVTIVGAGTTTITAYQNGNAEFLPATPVERTLDVAKADQQISFENISNKSLAEESFYLTATATSGLLVTFETTDTDKIDIDMTHISILAAGSVTIAASQSGNANYNAATTVSKTFCIDPLAPTITLSDENEVLTLSSDNPGTHVWFRDGVAIPNQDGQTTVVEVSGTYTAKVSVDGCMSAASNEIQVLITATSTPQNRNVAIHPNPVLDHFIITGLDDQTSSAELISTIGVVTTLALEKTMEGHRGTLTDLRPGVYVVRVAGANKLDRLRIVKK